MSPCSRSFCPRRTRIKIIRRDLDTEILIRTYDRFAQRVTRRGTSHSDVVMGCAMKQNYSSTISDRSDRTVSRRSIVPALSEDKRRIKRRCRIHPTKDMNRQRMFLGYVYRHRLSIGTTVGEPAIPDVLDSISAANRVPTIEKRPKPRS